MKHSRFESVHEFLLFLYYVERFLFICLAEAFIWSVASGIKILMAKIPNPMAIISNMAIIEYIGYLAGVLQHCYFISSV